MHPDDGPLVALPRCSQPLRRSTTPACGCFAYSSYVTTDSYTFKLLIKATCVSAESTMASTIRKLKADATKKQKREHFAKLAAEDEKRCRFPWCRGDKDCKCDICCRHRDGYKTVVCACYCKRCRSMWPFQHRNNLACAEALQARKQNT